MIRAYPQMKNLVVVHNEAHSQNFQGRLWFGENDSPKLTILKWQPGDKPINIQGYDLIATEGLLVAYGDKKLQRHEIDELEAGNRLLFWSVYPLGAEAALARWLVRGSGDMVSNEGIVRIAQYIQRTYGQRASRCYGGWYNILSDLFRPHVHAYEVFSKPETKELNLILRQGRGIRMPEEVFPQEEEVEVP
jgi:hypothetical protein